LDGWKGSRFHARETSSKGLTTTRHTATTIH
jgi:hypothetical protein